MFIITENKPDVRSSKGNDGEIPHLKTIAIGAVLGFLVLLVFCIILVIALVRSTRRRKKQPAASDADVCAHDNPGYAVTQVPEPIYR